MASPLVMSALLGCALRSGQSGRMLAATRSWMHRAESMCASSHQRAFPMHIRAFSALPPHTVLDMPSLSPTMSQGNLVKWHVKEGEQVGPGSVLADIETDKATLAFENQEDGYVAKLLVLENTKDIPVGTPVAVLVEEKEYLAAFANYGPGQAAAAAAAAAPPPPAPVAKPAPPPPPPARTASSYPPHTRLTMPSLSPTMETGNIVKWLVEEGTVLKPGDLIAEIETDKATLGFENQDEGVLARILLPSGSNNVPVGAIVAIIVDEPSQVAAFAAYSEHAAAAPAAAAPSTSAPAPAPAAAAPPAPAPGAKANSKLGPAARMLLDESGLSREQITPTGPNDIITKGDVLTAIAAGIKPAAAAAPAAAAPAPAAAAAAPAPAPAPAAKAPAAAAAAAPAAPAGATYIDTPNSQIRKVIASRLLESKVTIPALYLSADAQLDMASKFRSMLLEQGIKVSLNDVVLKAVAAALVEVPAANAFWDPAAQEARGFPGVDICVAVATERGLMTPIVKAADRKSLQQISKDVRELAGKARDNKLKPEEFMGGSFTVSNLGMMGVASFCAIINPPQAAILAVGCAQQRAVLVDGKPAAQAYMTLTLSADHRVYDGELASKLLQAIKSKVENPFGLLM